MASAPPPPDRQRSTLAALPYLFREALLAWWNDDVPRLGASLAYYTLFAIAPVLLVAIAIAGAVFGEEAVRGEIVGQLDELLGRDGAQAVQALLEGARRDTGDVLATVLGGITFALAATGAFLELQTALNTIWRVKPKENVNVASFLWDRVRSFALVVAIGFLLLVSLAVSAALAALNTWLNRSLPGMPLTLWSVVNLAAVACRHRRALRHAVSLSPRSKAGVAARHRRRAGHDRAVQHRQAGDWPVSRPEHDEFHLRRGGVSRGAAAVGVLLVASGAARRRVHPRLH